MPKVKIAAGDFSGVDAATGFSDYTGPVPPKGLYRTKIKLFRLVENSSGDPMFKIIFEIAEPKKSKNAKYNGYAIWHNANLTEKSAPFVNAMLDALGIARKAVWVTGVVVSKENPEDVVKIGGKSPIGLEVLVNGKRKTWNDEPQLAVASFLEAPALSSAKDADDDDSDDSDDSDDDDSSDDNDDDDGDDDGDDDDSF